MHLNNSTQQRIRSGCSVVISPRFRKVSAIAIFTLAGAFTVINSASSQEPTATTDPQAQALNDIEHKAKMAEADARIAQAKANKAKANRDIADARYPATSAEAPGGTTSIADAKIEVQLQAYRALAKIAKQMSDDLFNFQPNVRNVVIYDANTAKARQQVRGFREIVAFLTIQYEIANPSPGAFIDPATLGATIGAVKSVAEILSFFNTDISIAGQEVELTESALVGALISSLNANPSQADPNQKITVHYPSVLLPLTTDQQRDQFMARITELQRHRIAADVRITQEQETINDPATPDETKATARERVEHLQTLNALVDHFLGGLFTLDEKSGEAGPNALASLLSAAALDDLLQQPTTYTLRPNVHYGSGNIRTKSNIFTKVFTGSRIAFSGGAIVSYELYNNMNTPVSAELIPAYLPYASSGEISKRIDGKDTKKAER